MPSLDLGPVVGPQGEQGATGAQGIRGEQGLPGPNQLTNSTATPLTGVLTGNGSVVGVRPIDNTPTANSEGFPTSGGVKTALDGKAPVYGLGKNLLDNWYFVNPVNQRGQSSYSSTGFGVDRWNLGIATGASSPTMSLTSTGILLNGSLTQHIEMSRAPDGVTCTLSIIYSNGTLRTNSGVLSSSNPNWQLISGSANSDGIAIRPHTSAGVQCWQIAAWETNNKTLVAFKLEFGAEQTLCHNEGTAANPVWVLNEIPDYGEELRKCQRYYFSFQIPSGVAMAVVGLRGDMTTGTNVGAQIDFPVVMARVPTVDAVAHSIRGNGTNWNTGLSVTTTPLGMWANHIAVEVIASNASFPGLTSGYAVLFSKLNFSAEL